MEIIKNNGCGLLRSVGYTSSDFLVENTRDIGPSFYRLCAEARVGWLEVLGPTLVGRGKSCGLVGSASEQVSFSGAI